MNMLRLVLRIIAACVCVVAVIGEEDLNDVTATASARNLQISLQEASSSSQLEPEQEERQEHRRQREHIVRRLYGDANALVRKEISALEELIPRYQTGLPEDPQHIVPYENHPLDPKVRRRIQETNMTANFFQPIRIVFETQALDDVRNSSNAAMIDWYKTVILPEAAEYWTNTLSVVPVIGNLSITTGSLHSFTYCGDPAFTQVRTIASSLLCVGSERAISYQIIN